jgi:hypothetical protein
MKTPQQITTKMNHYNSLITEQVIHDALTARSKRQAELKHHARDYELAARFEWLTENLEGGNNV